MLWVSCPNCGERSSEEFRYGGELPHVPDRVIGDEARNVDLVWMLDNVAGPNDERWFHEAGCRRWFTARRDTRTDRFDRP